jgi:hypothetical protein
VREPVDEVPDRAGVARGVEGFGEETGEKDI